MRTLADIQYEDWILKCERVDGGWQYACFQMMRMQLRTQMYQ